MAKVEQKQPIVAEISEAIKDAASIVLVTYSGITVEQDTAMRKELREAGVSYKVYKNTMMNFAFKGTDFEALAPYLGKLLGSIQSPIANFARVISQIAEKQEEA